MNIEGFGFDLPKEVKLLCYLYGIKPDQKSICQCFIELLKAASSAHDLGTFELALYYMLTKPVAGLPFYVRFRPCDMLVVTFGVIDLQEQADQRCQYLKNILVPPMRNVSNVYIIYFIVTDNDVASIQDLANAAREGKDVLSVCDIVLYRLWYDGQHFHLDPIAGSRKNEIISQYYQDFMDAVLRAIPIVLAKSNIYTVTTEMPALPRVQTKQAKIVKTVAATVKGATSNDETSSEAEEEEEKSEAGEEIESVEEERAEDSNEVEGGESGLDTELRRLLFEK